MAVDFLKYLPQKVCFCLEFDPGVKILLALVIILRFVGMIMGCFYGPYIYIVLPLGGLYLAADCLLLHSVKGAFAIGGNLGTEYDDKNVTHHDADADNQCDFKTQRIWIFIWLVLNVIGLVGLLTAIGLFGALGTWAMLHQPIHFALFIWIIMLSILLVYTHLIVTTLYIYLKDAWLQSLLGGPWDDSQPGLTHNGKRVVIH